MKHLISIFIMFLVAQSQAAIKLAITVDDLPTHGNLPPGVTREAVAKKMLATFKKHKVPEVYAFINAGKVEVKNESFEVLKLWQEAGYPFGNHTYLHEDLHKNSVADFTKAIEKNEPMLKKISGDKNWKFFRYPYLREGDTLEKRNGVRAYLKEHGYQTAQVTVDFEDWSWNDPYARCQEKKDAKTIEWLKETYLQNANDHLDRAEKLSQSLFKRPIPHILLLHIGAFDAERLDELLTNYEKKGVQFIPLAEASKDEIYAQDPGVTGKWGAEMTYQIMKMRKLKIEDMGLTKYEGYPQKKLEEVCR